MISDQESTLLIAIAVGLFMLGMAFGNSVGTGVMRKEAIKNGAAYFHPQTGEFTWNVHPTKLEDIPK